MRGKLYCGEVCDVRGVFTVMVSLIYKEAFFDRTDWRTLRGLSESAMSRSESAPQSCGFTASPPEFSEIFEQQTGF